MNQLKESVVQAPVGFICVWYLLLRDCLQRSHSHKELGENSHHEVVKVLFEGQNTVCQSVNEVFQKGFRGLRTQKQGFRYYPQALESLCTQEQEAPLVKLEDLLWDFIYCNYLLVSLWGH